MYKTLKSFEFFEPTSFEEASRILSKFGQRAKLLAGGVDLIYRMRQREVEPVAVVSIQRVAGSEYISITKSELRIGALTRLRSIERGREVKENYTLLWEAIHQIDSLEVKNMGTLVGNLCVATPASDVATSLLALDGRLKSQSSGLERTIPLERFYTGVGKTTLGPGEIVTEVILPRLPHNAGTAFTNLNRTPTDISKVAVAVVLTKSGDVCNAAKIALGAVAQTVIRAKKAENMLMGQRLTEHLIENVSEAAASGAKPITDIRSTADYRRLMVKILVRRAIKTAWERALR